MVKKCRAACLSALALFVFVAMLMAGVPANAQSRYQIGSPNTVTADPPVQRPQGQFCRVVLFQNLQFEDFDPKSFTYTPATKCPGPWQKVVFEADFAVTPGIQFDRTGNIFVGGVPIYFGTTAEPSSNFGPNWHVETDVTEYAALFGGTQSGQVDLGNLVNDQYTGIISGSAALEFYPGTPTVAPFDQVLPLSASSDGGTVALNTPTDTLSGTFTLPTNVIGAYLDVFLQSQSNDEFWYTCVPSDVSSELESCPNTAYREGEVTIDGQPAGVAPVYPWIYTGGIDPYLWFPLPGVQTLNFKPYRVNLTPFAGTLDDGQPHTVSVSVYNVDSYFSATGAFLLQLDKNATQVTGAVTQNTLAATPNPKVAERVHTDANGNLDGNVSVKSSRVFTIAGYVIGSAGMVETTLQQQIKFVNQQVFLINDTVYNQDITQDTRIQSTVTTAGTSGTNVAYDLSDWPLTVNYNFTANSDGTGTQTATITQTNSDQTRDNGPPKYTSSTSNTVTSTDMLEFDSAGNLTGNTGQSSQQQYVFGDSSGTCYNLTLTAAANVLTTVTNGCN